MTTQTTPTNELTRLANGKAVVNGRTFGRIQDAWKYQKQLAAELAAEKVTASSVTESKPAPKNQSLSSALGQGLAIGTIFHYLFG